MKVKPLSNVRIVLVNTTHPGNIGAAARAMKTMGLRELTLVAPLAFPHPEADARATSALDVVQQAKVVPTLEDAIADCGLVIATSAQSRHMPWPQLSPREVGEAVKQHREAAPVAIVFGRERDGLTNEELQLARYHVQIPTDPECRCLNLAQAVQVLCYEVMQAHFQAQQPDVPKAIASAKDHERLYTHLEKTLIDIDFLDPSQPKKLMPRLQRLFAKAQIEPEEMHIIRGILTAVNKTTVND